VGYQKLDVIGQRSIEDVIAGIDQKIFRLPPGHMIFGSLRPTATLDLRDDVARLPARQRRTPGEGDQPWPAGRRPGNPAECASYDGHDRHCSGRHAEWHARSSQRRAGQR